MTSTNIDIEKLRKIVELFKAYDKIRNRTPLEKILVQEEKKFSGVYTEINLERSNEINPLTACATGTNAAVVLSEIMFSGGQSSLLSRLRQDEVLDVIDCIVENKNFVSTVHFKNAQDFHNEHHTTEQRNKDDEIKLLLSFAQNSQSCLMRETFLDKVKKRCIDNKNIYHDMSVALDNDVLEYFKKLSKIPAIIFGDGIGQYEGNDLSTFCRVQATLFEKFNIRFIAVEKEYIELVEPLKEVNPDLNIAIIDQEELLKFTKEYNNTECDNATRESFMEALVKHFNLSLTFSKKDKPVTITKKLVHDESCIEENKNSLRYRLVKVSYCAEGLEQKQNFYDENQIKNAIKQGEKIDVHDPIVYALHHGILLENKFPILYAMENTIKIEGADPTLWAKENKYDVEGKEPIVYAIEHAIRIEGKDPTLWAHEDGYKIGKESVDPIVYAMKQHFVKRYEKGEHKYEPFTIAIEGKDAKEWISNAINNSQKIGDKDARAWLTDAIKEATEKEGFNSVAWRIYPPKLLACAVENKITLDGKYVEDLVKEAEKKRLMNMQHKYSPSPTADTLTTNSTSNQRNPQNCFPKLNWFYIAICINTCVNLTMLTLGVVGGDDLTVDFVVGAIVGSIIFGAVLGGLIGTCVSDTEVSQPNPNGLGRQ